jgi:uncharacterized membrane protein YccC
MPRAVIVGTLIAIAAALVALATLLPTHADRAVAASILAAFCFLVGALEGRLDPF